VAVLRLEQHNPVAWVSVNNEAIIGAIINRKVHKVDFGERQRMFEEAQQVLRIVAQYTKPASMVQRVCDR